MRLFGKIEVEPRMFGDLYFMATNERMEQDGAGNATGKLARREYSLDSTVQRMVVVIRIPGDVPERKFKPDDKVELVSPRVFPYVRGDFRNREVVWIIEADDIRAVKPGQVSPPPKPQGDNK